MPKTHYTLVNEENKSLAHEGQATSVPAVGDSIEADGDIFVVKRRHWRTAADVMSAEEARHRLHADTDIVHVSLAVELVASTTEEVEPDGS